MIYRDIKESTFYCKPRFIYSYVKLLFRGQDSCMVYNKIFYKNRLVLHLPLKMFSESLIDHGRISSLRYTRKNAQVVTSLQTSCNKSVHKLLTSCLRTACS